MHVQGNLWQRLLSAIAVQLAVVGLISARPVSAATKPLAVCASRCAYREAFFESGRLSFRLFWPYKSHLGWVLRAAVICITFAGLVSTSSAFATTYTVNTNSDTDSPGTTTLRDAINAVNSGPCTGDTINFNIPTTDAQSIFSISPSTPFPIIHCQVTLDGTTQPGWSPGLPVVELNGQLIPRTFSPTVSSYPAGLLLVGRDRMTGLKIFPNPDGSVIRGLLINKFPDTGIYLYGTDAVTITGNYIGLDGTGEKAGFANIGGLFLGFGLTLEGSSNNFVGTTFADYAAGTINIANRNLIGSARSFVGLIDFNADPHGYGLCSGVTPEGCRQPELGSTSNVFQGNYFGLNKEGNCAIGGFTSDGAAGNPGGCPDHLSSSAVFSARNVGLFIGGPPAPPPGFPPFPPSNENNQFGGLNPGQGNVLVAANQAGAQDFGLSQQIVGNIFGADPNGNAQANIPREAGFALLGSGTVVKNNIFGNSKGFALQIGGNATPDTDIKLVGNFFGTNRTGADIGVGNYNAGILVVGNVYRTDIENNVVAFNGLILPGGIIVQSATIGTTTYSPHVSILSNQIYGNEFTGIDLVVSSLLGSGDGPTLNNPSNNPGTGPNGLQEFPVIDASRSVYNPAQVVVKGVLNSRPNTSYRLQFFSNPNAGDTSVPGSEWPVCLQLTTTPPAGYIPNCPVDPGFSTSFLASQGKVMIGQTDVITNSNGYAAFTTPSPLSVAVGSVITATATLLTASSDGSLIPTDTSEFSQAVDIKQDGADTAYTHASGATTTSTTTPADLTILQLNDLSASWW